MSLSELLSSIQYMIDAEGKRQAVVLDLAVWEELLALLEDLEDEEEMAEARQEEDETIPWEQVVADYQAAHPDLDV